jgi:hypothetical protein
MNTDKTSALRIICVHLCSSVVLISSGCAGPSKANIELRRQNQALRDQIDDLNRRHEADQATIKGMQSNVPLVPTLPEDRLAKLFTTHGLRLGRLTAGADLDPNIPGDEGLRIYVVPTDNSGEPIKAAGSFVVEAFDLSEPGDNRVGKWEFPVEQAQKNWFGHLTQYTYVLSCPWQSVPPKHADVTVKVTFADELTGRRFDAEKVIKVSLPPAPTPSG